jgi:hypothetical protein
MVVGDKKFGVVSYVLVGGGGGPWVFPPRNLLGIFLPLGLKFEHFLKQIFGYTAYVTLCFDQTESDQLSTSCMVCLCKYHTQGVGSLLNLVDPTPTRRYQGWRRAGKF